MWHIQCKHHADTVWPAAFLCFYYELITVVAKETRCMSSFNSSRCVGCSTLSRTWHQYMLADVNRMQKYSRLLSALLQCASLSSVSLLLSPHSGEVMLRKSPLSSHPWKYLCTVPIKKTWEPWTAYLCNIRNYNICRLPVAKLVKLPSTAIKQ